LGEVQDPEELKTLKDKAPKNQWWKMKYVFPSNKDGQQQTMTLEALLSQDQGKVLRMRALFPNEPQPQEMMVTENQYYVPPQRLTKESMKGATVGSESVTVPAGTFAGSRHVRFGNPGQGNWDWWLSDKVPGGVVKQQMTPSQQAQHDRQPRSIELQAYGDGAKTELASF
jgi:hypothetical protein